MSELQFLVILPRRRVTTVVEADAAIAEACDAKKALMAALAAVAPPPGCPAMTEVDGVFLVCDHADGHPGSHHADLGDGGEVAWSDCTIPACTLEAGHELPHRDEVGWTWGGEPVTDAEKPQLADAYCADSACPAPGPHVHELIAAETTADGDGGEPSERCSPGCGYYSHGQNLLEHREYGHATCAECGSEPHHPDAVRHKPDCPRLKPGYSYAPVSVDAAAQLPAAAVAAGELIPVADGTDGSQP